MADSKYTYKDFLERAKAFGPDVTADDYTFASGNPDGAMALLGYMQDYRNAISSGNDSAAYLAKDAINGVRSGYAPAPSVTSAAPAGTVSSSPATYNGRDLTHTMKYLAGGDKPGVDANGDGAINMRDVTSMMRSMVGSTPSGAAGAASSAVPTSGQSQSGGARVNPWGDEYARALREYLDGGGVNVEASDLWHNYRNQYRRESDRAVEDLLGKMTAAAGGRVSSSAGSAAAQMQNYYLSQLNDRYPEIYEALRAEQLQRLGLLSDAEATAYARNYQEGRDAVADDQWRQEYLRLIGRDARSDYESDRSYEYQLGRDRIADAYAAAQYNDYSGLQALGVDVSRYLADLDYQRQVDAAMKAASLEDYSLFDSLFGTSVGAKTEAEANEQKQLERATAIYELTGDTTGLAEYYGIPKASIDSYLARVAAQSASSSRSSGGSSGGRTKTADDSGNAANSIKDLWDGERETIYQLADDEDWPGLYDYLGSLVTSGWLTSDAAARTWSMLGGPSDYEEEEKKTTGSGGKKTNPKGKDDNTEDDAWPPKRNPVASGNSGKAPSPGVGGKKQYLN